MIGRSELIPEIIREAATEGTLAEPIVLLEALAATDNPMMALARPDESNALFEAFYSDFSFLMSPRAMGPPLQSVERGKWVSLVRWITEELKTWQAASDPGSRKLVAIFIAAQASDWNNGFWQHMPEEIGKNADLVERLKTLIGSFSNGPPIEAGLTPPIWEREAIEAFQIADRAGDWVGIANGVKLFEHQLVPLPVVAQPVRCLCLCGIQHVIDALANVRQTVVALLIASALPVTRQLAVAAGSTNPYVEFACVYLAVSGKVAPLLLGPGDQQALRNL